MFDLTTYASKGTKQISLIGPSSAASSAALNRIAIVAPGGSQKVKSVKPKVKKAATPLAESQMAVALGGSNKKSGPGKKTGKKKNKKGGTGKKKTASGKVQKRGATLTITKGQVRLILESGKHKTFSAASLVRQLPIATVTKAASSLGRRNKAKAKTGKPKAKTGKAKAKTGKPKKKTGKPKKKN